MGDPKRQRKKFSKPSHPWQKERIEAEKGILNQYGLRRKYEIWKMDSMLKKFLHRAKTIIGERTSQSEKEKVQLLQRLYAMGLVKKDSKIEEVLNLTLKDLLERRLQTLVCRKQMASTMLQARQFITHEHIAVGSRKITAPSYLVSINEEPEIRLVHPVSLQIVAKEQKHENLKAE
ncbi:30S ribosomal protein S4 [Candidatus Woesearchaeota archaeon]|nr:30S ribosomal protein S4 [Candidatus Woesearchaeota archaeon]